MGRHEILETVAIADCAMDIEGDDLDDLFATAAAAVAELMVDPATVPLTVERQVRLTAPALDLLLYDWLSELIFLKDSERLVFPVASVTVRQHEAPCRLEARMAGGVIDRETTGLRADPKAVTMHQLAVERRARGWRARVVIDI
ncbi:MAG: archease [Candidatus Rokuibacteriota bacterium]